MIYLSKARGAMIAALIILLIYFISMEISIIV